MMKLRLEAFILFCSVFVISLSGWSFCFDEAAHEHGIHPDILRAIARVESNNRETAINKNRNGTYDFGVMQINSAWYSTLGVEKWNQLADPCFNVKTGAWVLRKCMDKYGYNWKAIDCYNKGSKARDSSSYVWKIYRAMEKIAYENKQSASTNN